ncbi:hypothetical protein ACIREE_14825 [Streptomyces sp. NPDC102467]|uniref:hypothetical protein n=1 Tax=Streptomyces sp. NPDC102467 TaxID=3366179 RepID=UPI003812735C
MNKNQLRQGLEIVGGLALIQGAVGLIHEFTGWLGWGLIQHIGFLDGREVYGSIALIVLAIALFAAAESQKTS